MTDDKRKYYVVQFDDGIQVIPRNWFVDGTQTKSYWPNYTNFKTYDKAVESMEEPDRENCPQFAVREIIGSSGKYKNIHFYI